MNGSISNDEFKVVCHSYCPNPFKLGLCMACQMRKSVHSARATRSIEHSMVADQDFDVTILCEGDGDECGFMEGERRVSLYDSGVVRMRGDANMEVLDVDMSDGWMRGTVRGNRECLIVGGGHCWSLRCKEEIDVGWKMMFKRIAEQNPASQRMQPHSDNHLIPRRLSYQNGSSCSSSSSTSSPSSDPTDVHAVLTESCLRTYQSPLSFKQLPKCPIRTVDLSGQYNILPMPFEKNHMFSLFKRGEKAEERLYLETSSKSDYDLWLAQIDGVINGGKADSQMMSRPTTISTSGMSNPSSQKVVLPRFNIKTNGIVSAELKQLQQSYDRLEADLKKEKDNCRNVALEREQLMKKQSELEKRASELKKERNDAILRIDGLNKEVLSLTEARRSDFNEEKMANFVAGLTASQSWVGTDLTTYGLLVDHLCLSENHSVFLSSLLEHLLDRLIHRCSIDPATEISLLQHLNNTLEMSADSISKFLAAFLSTLVRQMSASNNLLSTNLTTIIDSVVRRVPLSQEFPIHNASIQQTALEIAYVVGRQNWTKDHSLPNGCSKSMDIERSFDNFLGPVSIASVDKVFIVELGRQIQEQCQGFQLQDKKDQVVEHFTGSWETLLGQLRSSRQENQDLLVALEMLSTKNQELDEEHRDPDDWRNVDQMVNYYTSLSGKLCSSCQAVVAGQQGLPVSRLIDDLVEDIRVYWASLNDTNTFLASRRGPSTDLRAAIDMTKASNQRFERVISRMQEITQRTIKNPGTSRPKTTPREC